MERTLAVIGVFGILVQIAFIFVEHKEKYEPALLLKTIASAIFVFIGYKASLLCGDKELAKLILIGLGLGAVGDFFLNLRFVLKDIGTIIFLIGILVFLAGHVMYLIALIKLSHNPIIVAIIGLVLTALLIVWIFKRIEAKPAFKIFGVFYLGAVTLMATFAIANFLFAGEMAFNQLFAFGGVLFLVSDVILILNTFGKETKFVLRICNLMLYYVGQLAIAFSLLYK